MYHSHVSEVNDTNAGLVGPIVLLWKKGINSGNTLIPKDVDKEVFPFFQYWMSRKVGT